LPERPANGIPQRNIDPRNPKQRQPDGPMVIGQRPEFVANLPNEKGILADNRWRELVVDEVRQNRGRLVAAPKGDRAPAGDAILSFDDNPACAFGIKGLERVADRVGTPPGLCCRGYVGDLD
jgi:hypothetical protein